jgi:hypothetical protein
LEPTPVDASSAPPRKGWRPSLKLIIILLLVAGLATAFIVGGHDAVVALQDLAERSRTPTTLAILCTIFTLLLALPGVPGLEVAAIIMLVFGEVGILATWLCGALAFNASFFAGRLIPEARVQRWLTPKQVDEAKLPPFAVGQHDAMTLVLERNRVGRAILRWTGPPGGWRRYVLIFVLFNTPGNFVLGGGGGIALFCGTSRDLRWLPYSVTALSAAAVIPGLVWAGLLTANQFIQP